MRWRRRVASSASVSSSIAKGAGVAVLSSRSSLAATSTSPLGSFGFTVSGERRSTRPRTRITYSERSSPARW